MDAHADTAEHQSHFDLTHGTPFRRAWEDKLLDNTKVFQIGIRGWVNCLTLKPHCNLCSLVGYDSGHFGLMQIAIGIICQYILVHFM